MISKKIYFDGLRVGDELPPFPLAPLDRVSISRWAAAIGEHNPLSVDEEYARRTGFPSVCVPGPMAMSYLAELTSAWLQPGQMKRVTARFRKILWPGDQLVFRGRITCKRREASECYVDLEVWAENQKGDLAIQGDVTLRLYLNAEDEDRQRRGLLPMDRGDKLPSLVEVLEREMPGFDETATPRGSP